jgi:hypothetical protein
MVLVKNGWIAPTGTQYEENGYCWESHEVTPSALLALECYLQKVRFDAMPQPDRKPSNLSPMQITP